MQGLESQLYGNAGAQSFKLIKKMPWVINVKAIIVVIPRLLIFFSGGQNQPSIKHS